MKNLPFRAKCIYIENISFSGTSLSDIPFETVFLDVLFHRDAYPCEFQKHSALKKDNGFEHMKKFIKKFKKYKWKMGNISVLNLLTVYMFPAGWLRRYACQNTDCKYFKKQSECIKCHNKYMEHFTLNQCINGYYENEFSKKIENLKTNLTDENLFCTVIKNKHNKFFVMDGNSRLLSYSVKLTSKDELYNPANKIKIYVGEK